MATHPAPLTAQAPALPTMDRRRDDAVLMLVQEVLDGQNQMRADLVAHRSDLKKHIEEEDATFRAIMVDSFPGGDPEGHRRWHEADIKRLENKAELYKTLLTKLLEWGLIGFAGFAVFAIWAAVIKGPK